MIVECSRLGRRYGSTDVLSEASFTFAGGEIVGLLGPNGSGKSTLIRRMLGIDHGAGCCRFGDRSYAELTAPTAVVGAVLDPQALHPGLRVRHHVALAAAGISNEAVDRALNAVGLTASAHLRPRQLSLGMKQRLALAMALVAGPSVLILDEPTNGLDAHGIAWLADFLRAFARDGGAVLLSSHLLASVAQIAGRVVVLDRGRVVADSPVADFVGAKRAGGTIVRMSDPDELCAVALRRGAAVERLPGGTLLITGVGTPEVGQIIRDCAGVMLEIRPFEATLEAAYLDLIGER